MLNFETWLPFNIVPGGYRQRRGFGPRVIVVKAALRFTSIAAIATLSSCLHPQISWQGCLSTEKREKRKGHTRCGCGLLGYEVWPNDTLWASVMYGHTPTLQLRNIVVAGHRTQGIARETNIISAINAGVLYQRIDVDDFVAG
jgi:hypothetical protein